ncbi:hypothetical protein ASF75_14800 [Curtobacterium sp. Leaf154]|nr:hypothetical protein ASF75_14800 [Curtobacterium sp. Leaf154]
MDMLTASGVSPLVSFAAAVILGLVASKPFWGFLGHVVDVIDEHLLARNPERARRVAKLRRARLGKK